MKLNFLYLNNGNDWLYNVVHRYELKSHLSMRKFVSVSHLDVKQKLQTWKMTWKRHRPMLWKQLLKQITFNYLSITLVHVYVFLSEPNCKTQLYVQKSWKMFFLTLHLQNIFQSRCHFYKVRCCLFPLQRQGAWGKWWPQGILKNLRKVSFCNKHSDTPCTWPKSRLFLLHPPPPKEKLPKKKGLRIFDVFLSLSKSQHFD